MSAPIVGSTVAVTDALRVLPGAEELFNEFQGFTGDCGEFAELSALHIVSGITLNGANLDLIVRRDIDHGWASSNGGEPLSSIADDIAALKLLYTEYPFPGPSNWLEILKGEAGYQPVIIELANGQNLAGDEPGLHYHFICVVGLLTNGNFLCCDGDNIRRDAEHILCEYTPTMIDGAQPCGMIVVKYPQADDYGYVVEEDGSIIYNHSKIHLTGVIADFVKSHNLQEEALYEEWYFTPDYSVTPFTNNTVLVWDSVDKMIILNQSGEAIAGIIKKYESKP